MKPTNVRVHLTAEIPLSFSPFTGSELRVNYFIMIIFGQILQVIDGVHKSSHISAMHVH